MIICMKSHEHRVLEATNKPLTIKHECVIVGPIIAAAQAPTRLLSERHHWHHPNLYQKWVWVHQDSILTQQHPCGIPCGSNVSCSLMLVSFITVRSITVAGIHTWALKSVAIHMRGHVDHNPEEGAPALAGYSCIPFLS
jgi:hypothetical protein